MECNCVICSLMKEEKCKVGFPTMVWIAEGGILNGAVFARNTNEYTFLMNELAYALAQFVD